jgi:hypothetical protein
MLRDQSAIDANLTYLEAEAALIYGGPLPGKNWAVYGSPVCLFFMLRIMGGFDQTRSSIHPNSVPWDFHTGEIRQTAGPV